MVRAGLVAAVVLCTSLGGLLPAGADELPFRKPGLWEIRIKLTGGAAPTAMMRHCTDESVDRQMSTLFNPLAPPPCAKSTVRKEGDHYTVESGCSTDGKIVKIHSDISGDFQSAYTVVSETKTQDDPDSDPALSSVTLEGKYAGSCKFGQKPGDVMLAGGMKINVKDIENLKKLLKR
jgi:Protein of unknown function (DUF3617)